MSAAARFIELLEATLQAAAEPKPIYDLPGFIAAELVGALAGLIVMVWLLQPTPGLSPIN